MLDTLLELKRRLSERNSQMHWQSAAVFPGIELVYLTFEADFVSMEHSMPEDVLQINYCRAGQIDWEMDGGRHIFLNPGDLSLHTMKSCAHSALTFPTGQYQGLSLWIDLQQAAANPPELLRDTGIFPNLLQRKFCRNDAVAFLAGNEQTEHIFSGFYHPVEHLLPAYQRVKALDLLLYLAGMEFTSQSQLTEYQPEQIEIVRAVHDQLLRHMEQRVTIEALSKQYLINPTTLKGAFKSVYGTSIAAHIKEHRMEQAAKLLKETQLSIAEIAQAVGYDSQSKFSAAFKAYFHVLPREIRRR